MNVNEEILSNSIIRDFLKFLEENDYIRPFCRYGVSRETGSSSWNEEVERIMVMTNIWYEEKVGLLSDTKRCCIAKIKDEKILDNSSTQNLLEFFEDNGYLDAKTDADNHWTINNYSPLAHKEMTRIIVLTNAWYKINMTEIEDVANKDDTIHEHQCDSRIHALDAIVTYGSIAILSITCLVAIFGEIGVSIFVYTCYLITVGFSIYFFTPESKIEASDIMSLICGLNICMGVMSLWFSLLFPPMYVVVSLVLASIVTTLLLLRDKYEDDNEIYLKNFPDVYIISHKFNRLVKLSGLVIASIISMPIGGYMNNENILALMIIPIMLILQRFKIDKARKYPEIKRYEDQIGYMFAAIASLSILGHLAADSKVLYEVLAMLSEFIEKIIIFFDASFYVITGTFVNTISAISASHVAILVIILITFYIVDSDKWDR